MTAQGEIAALFRDATVRQRLYLAALLSALLGTGAWGCSYVGAAMGNMVPVKRTIIVQRLVRHSYPPLKDPLDACRGYPAVINKLVVTEPADKKDDWVSWFTLRPAGDDYLVYCRKAGATGDMWQAGDLIRLYGEPA